MSGRYRRVCRRNDDAGPRIAFQEDHLPMTVLSEPDRALAPMARATADAALVGAFQVRIPLILSANASHEELDADGFAVAGPIEPGTDFHLRQAPDTWGITLTAKTVADLHGRVLTGVALDEASQRFTPVALAIPTEMNIEFGISWQAEAWSYVVGDNR